MYCVPEVIVLLRTIVGLFTAVMQDFSRSTGAPLECVELRLKEVNEVRSSS